MIPHQMVVISSLNDNRRICYKRLSPSPRVWYKKISNHQLHGGTLESPRGKEGSQKLTLFKGKGAPKLKYPEGLGAIFKPNKMLMGEGGAWIFLETTQFDIIQWPTRHFNRVKLESQTLL